jgi:uncharacterized protein YggT (Ycf19 family)
MLLTYALLSWASGRWDIGFGIVVLDALKAVTKPLLFPLRKIMPEPKGTDSAPLVGAFILIVVFAAVFLIRWLVHLAVT